MSCSAQREKLDLALECAIASSRATCAPGNERLYDRQADQLALE